MRHFLHTMVAFSALLAATSGQAKAQVMSSYPALSGQPITASPEYTYSPFGGIVKVGPKEYVPVEPGVFLKSSKHFGSRTVIDYNYYVPQVPENGYYARRYLFERR